MRKKEILPLMTTNMNPEGIMLGEVSQHFVFRGRKGQLSGVTLGEQLVSVLPMVRYL